MNLTHLCFDSLRRFAFRMKIFNYCPEIIFFHCLQISPTIFITYSENETRHKYTWKFDSLLLINKLVPILGLPAPSLRFFKYLLTYPRTGETNRTSHKKRRHQSWLHCSRLMADVTIMLANYVSNVVYSLCATSNISHSQHLRNFWHTKYLNCVITSIICQTHKE